MYGKIQKKGLSILLTLAMVLSLMPAMTLPVFAATNATFGFEADTTGVGTKTVNQTVSENTLEIKSTTVSIVDSSTTSGQDISGTVTLSTDYGTALETQLVFSVSGDKIFDFDAITIFNVNTNDTFTFTSSNGATYSVLITAGETKTVDLSANTDFQGISSVTLTATDPYAIDFDDVSISNIQAIDTTAPAFDVAPSVGNKTSVGFTPSASIDEGGTIYYVVVVSGDTAPTASQIKNGKNASNSDALASSSSAVSSDPYTSSFTAITGLSSNTNYDVYFVAEDDESTPNIQASVTKIVVTTDIAQVPTMLTNEGLTLNEGATASIPLDTLEADDADTDNSTLLYTVTASLANGQLENTDNPGVSISSFTQQNLIDGKIQYVHDGTNTTSDSFTFKVSDGTNELTGQTFSISVNAVDDDTPTVSKNKGLSLDEGATATIDLNLLECNDTDSDNATLMYTLTASLSNGQLENTDNPGVAILSFTQQNLIDEKICYVHDGTDTTSDSFTFKVSDGTNELTGQTFSITIAPADVEITGFDAISNVSAGTAGSATYANAAAVIEALPTTATANTSAVTVPVSTWVDTDSYNTAVAGSYTFTATLGTIPSGYANTGSYTATVEVVVSAPADVEITGFDAISNVSGGTAGSATYANAAAVIAALPTTATANTSAVTVPVSTWVDTDSYNPAVAGSYTFTATLGTIPSGYANTGSYTATVEVVVSASADVEITGFDAISNVSAGTAGSATYANAAAVIAALPTTATANTSAVTVPVSTWVDTDSYNPAVAGSYTFTATLGTIPSGYANTGSYTATVEVVVSASADVEITGFDAISNVSGGTAGSATYANAVAVIAALPTTATANTSAVTVPVSAWVDTDNYNPAVAGSYTFTATLGTIPSGYANTGSYTATVEVVVSAPSNDATLKTSSIVKGQVVTNLGTPNATLGSETAGAVTITAAKAADTSNVGSFITLFDKSDANATVKVVKYVSGASMANFGTDTAYANQTLRTGDFFIVKVTAEDATTVNYYKVNVTVTSASSGSSGGGGGSSSTTTQPSQNTVVVVNGKEQNAGKETQTTENGKSTVTITVDNKVVESKIDEAIKTNTAGIGNVVQVPVADTKSDVVKVELTGDIVKKLEANAFDVSVKRDSIEYVIPAAEFTIRKVAENLGIQEKALADIKVEVQIAKLDKKVVEKYNEVAKANGAELVFPPVEFEIVAKTTTTDGTAKEQSINKFSNYVERVMEIPAGVDPDKITTGIVFNADGTYSHVPTEVYQKDGKWCAKLNSMTNSDYSVIWNPVTVKSVENHWAKDAVNDMASRLVIFNPEEFEPNKAIARADFAEYIVRALGLYREDSTHENNFKDVSAKGERTLAILIANEYGIVSGYCDGTFRGDNQITREEAMVMYQRAMEITKLVGSDDNRYQSYTDYSQVSDWAKINVKNTLSAHVFNGTTATNISPKASLTYAEAAQAIRNLLIESKLISE